MIFRKISYRIAAQFMAFVFAMLLVTGGIFIAADVVSRSRMIHTRLERQLRPLLERSDIFDDLPSLPPFQRDRLRIANAEGRILWSGALYEGIPFMPNEGIVTVTREEEVEEESEEEFEKESYDIFTVPLRNDGQLVGYIQIAERSLPHDLLFRILLFLLISGGISFFTFGVGLFFARRSLKPAEQMVERLEQFTQDASHELRTPLTAVNTSLDMALVDEDPLTYVRAAKKDLKEVSTLVERLLELAQLDAFVLRREAVKLDTIVAEAIKRHRPFADEKEILLESDLQPLEVEGDPPLLRQVVSNLLSNAIKFNRPGGRVFIRLTPEALTIEDTGKGISREALPHIFDRFYQEDASRSKPTEGMGLGLSLLKRIVDLHGWTVAVKSETGKGTTFTLRFARRKRRLGP